MTHRLVPVRSFTLLIRLAGISLLVAGCQNDEKIVIENALEENQPPIIVKYGPEVPPGGFEQMAQFCGGRPGIDLWALVGDPNGLDDISLVAADIDSVRLLHFVLRPDTSGCLAFSYTPDKMILTAGILPVPAKFPGVELRPLIREQGGLYVAPGLGSTFGFPDLLSASSLLEPWGGGCGGPCEQIVYGPIDVLPPAVPSERTAMVSYAEVEYYGISITVYDKIGATASVTMPTLRVVYTTSKEKDAASQLKYASAWRDLRERAPHRSRNGRRQLALVVPKSAGR